MVLNPVINHQVTDLLIVPVSISYDRALEENLFACELLGIPKPKESTSVSIKTIYICVVHLGRVVTWFRVPAELEFFFSRVGFVGTV